MKMLFAWSCGFAWIALLAVGSLNADEKTPSYTFRSQRAVGAVDRVESALDLGGEQKIVEDSKVQRFKMSGLANLTYDERTLELAKESKAAVRAVRYYDKATATLQIDTVKTTPTLREERRLIGAAIDGTKAMLFSPRGPLTRDELDLVDPLGNSLLVERFLPEKPVAIGEKWEHSAELMTALLGLDAVSEAKVSSTLLTVDPEKPARFEMTGRVSGAIGGVATEIELQAKYHFDRKTNRVTWFGLLVKENRSVGHIGPGLEITARLQMKIVPGSQSDQLSDRALAGLTLKPTPALTQLAYESQGGWDAMLDRRWYVTADDAKLAILRLVDRGEFVAQCKISASPAKDLTLAAFQEDIKRGLGKSFKQFVEAGQATNDRDYRVYRVVVEGEASDLPIQWIYYYVADRYGHQAVLAFTVEGRLVETFAKADDVLLRTFDLADPKIAAKP
ncbi:MAG: hypothetical protein ABFD16_06335 [Thermoguttaceae bacterium]|jgi:hypothetical protein